MFILISEILISLIYKDVECLFFHMFSGSLVVFCFLDFFLLVLIFELRASHLLAKNCPS
jgi:hypothetical protein